MAFGDFQLTRFDHLIHEFFDLAALQAHKSQLGEFDIPNMKEWLRNWCKEMAKGEDYELGEAFHRELITW